jgi:hypothetical protein
MWSHGTRAASFLPSKPCLVQAYNGYCALDRSNERHGATQGSFNRSSSNSHIYISMMYLSFYLFTYTYIYSRSDHISSISFYIMQKRVHYTDRSIYIYTYIYIYIYIKRERVKDNRIGWTEFSYIYIYIYIYIDC